MSEKAAVEQGQKFEVFSNPNTDEGLTSLAKLGLKDKKRPPKKYRFPYGEDPKRQGFYWPESDVKRSEFLSILRNSPNVAQSVYQCSPGTREGSVFFRRWFRYFRGGENIVTGRGGLPAELRRPDARIGQSWDTAITDNSGSARSARITAVLVPCRSWHRGEDPAVFGECEPHYDIYVVESWAGKPNFPELSLEVRAGWQAWAPESILVEEKASGSQILQTLMQAGVPLRGMKAGDSKRARAVNPVGAGQGSVQGWMAQGRIVFWADSTWLKELETEILDFTGVDDASNDSVDALVHLVTWGIWLSGQQFMIGDGVGGAHEGRTGALEQWRGVAGREAIRDAVNQRAFEDMISGLEGVAGDPRREMLNQFRIIGDQVKARLAQEDIAGAKARDEKSRRQLTGHVVFPSFFELSGNGGEDPEGGGLGPLGTIDPFAQLCGRCGRWDKAKSGWCPLWARRKAAIDSCPSWISPEDMRRNLVQRGMGG